MRAAPVSPAQPRRPAGEGAASLLSAPSPRILDGAVRHTVRSDGLVWDVDLWVPANLCDRRTGSVVVLDGHATFATTVDALRLQSARPATTGVGPAVVVGLSPPSVGLFDEARRRRDLTPWPAEADDDAAPAAGGADQVLDFLCDRLLPEIEAATGAAVDRRGLFGHSLGGLFALHALFTRPTAFAALAAASPSLWWNPPALRREEAVFAGWRPERRTRLFLSVGSEERRPDRRTAEPCWTGDEIGALAARLAESDPRRLAVDFVVFPCENHGSVLPAAISRALRVLSPAE